MLARILGSEIQKMAGLSVSPAEQLSLSNKFKPDIGYMVALKQHISLKKIFSLNVLAVITSGTGQGIFTP
jgi:hypothetical protein